MQTKVQVRFGSTLVRLRAERSWTQDDLSVRSKVTVKHISSLENGHREPCLGIMIKLAAAFGMKASQLIEGID